MHVQVNTDRHVVGSDDLQLQVEQVVESALGRFGERVTRVEVHLNDVNGKKSGDDDIRCMMEARLGGMQPVAATHEAASLDQALDGVAKKLQRLLDSTLGKMADQERANDRQ